LPHLTTTYDHSLQLTATDYNLLILTTGYYYLLLLTTTTTYYLLLLLLLTTTYYYLLLLTSTTTTTYYYLLLLTTTLQVKPGNWESSCNRKCVRSRVAADHNPSYLSSLVNSFDCSHQLFSKFFPELEPPKTQIFFFKKSPD